MEVLLEEARESYEEHIVVELHSDEAADDVEENVERIESWIRNWHEDHDARNSTQMAND